MFMVSDSGAGGPKQSLSQQVAMTPIYTQLGRSMFSGFATWKCLTAGCSNERLGVAAETRTAFIITL